MAGKPTTGNILFYGDNLPILREYVPTGSIDLIYLDPPFNSSRSYNVLFKDESGHESDAQITAFEDTWHWNSSAEETFHGLNQDGPPLVARMIRSLRDFIGTNQMMAYLVMMAVRLGELHRVLKPTGSLYLHCDPTASHYLKILLDIIFCGENFVNEIIWKRTSAHSDAKQGAKHFGRSHDVLLFYTKTKDFVWNPLYSEHEQDYINVHYPYTEQDTGRRYGLWDITGPGGAAKGNPIYDIFGITKYWRYSRENMEQKIREGRVIQPKPGTVPREKRYLDDSSGVAFGTIWTDIPPINSQAAERLGYPTQKPLALLERIIQASSNPGDIVLDPFCGCGTAIAAAQKLGRAWIGVDITHLAITLQKYRLKDMFGIVAGVDYKVIGEPTDLGSAHQLASENRYQFQWWALSLVRAKPLGGSIGAKSGKKGKDRGIDGVITFIDDKKETVKEVLVQVKSGKIKSGDIRDLRGTVERENSCIGVFVTLEQPTSDMQTEAVSAGFYESGFGTKFPRIQLLTIEELLKGAQVKMPPFRQTFKQARKEQPSDTPKQASLWG